MLPEEVEAVLVRLTKTRTGTALVALACGLGLALSLGMVGFGLYLLLDGHPISESDRFAASATVPALLALFGVRALWKAYRASSSRP